MPIRADLRKHYGREWIKETRPRILARAKNRCERCGKPNRSLVLTASGHYKLPGRRDYWMFWRSTNDSIWTDQDGKPAEIILPADRVRMTHVVLTIAHVNHDPTDNSDDNLQAWCQWCHLIHDVAHHRESRGFRKDKNRPIITLIDSRRAHS
jgi:hypothetical protein